MADNFKINSAIVCDDFRTENTGKLLLIGIYPNTIQFKNLPITYPLSVCLLGTADGNDFSVILRIEFIAENKENSRHYDHTLDVKSANESKKKKWTDVILPIKTIPVEFNSEGILIVKVKSKSGKIWKELANKSILISASSI